MMQFMMIAMISLLLIGAILIQNSKGGMNSKLSNVYQLLGVKRGTDSIEKITWVLALSLFFVSLL